MLCTSGFVDDDNGPQLSTTLCLKGVRQVAVPVGRQTTTVFGRVHHHAAAEAKTTVYCTTD